MWEERKIAQRIAIFNHPTATISFFTLYFFPPLLVLERIIIAVHRGFSFFSIFYSLVDFETKQGYWIVALELPFVERLRLEFEM